MSTLHPCPGTGPGTVQYDACHAADEQTIADLRAQLAEAQAELVNARAAGARNADLYRDANAARQQAEAEVVRLGGALSRVGTQWEERYNRDVEAERAARQQAERERDEAQKAQTFAEERLYVQVGNLRTVEAQTLEMTGRALRAEAETRTILTKWDGLTEQRDRAVAALRAVEWVHGRCPWCGDEDVHGHAADCRRQAALRETEHP